MINKIANRNGFTLIEILASIVLLTVVISLFLSIFPQVGNMNHRNGENLDAANVAKEILVLVKKNYSIDNSTLTLKGNILDFTISQNNTNSTFVKGTYETLNNNTFFIELEIKKTGAIPNSSVENIYQVTIKIKNSPDNTNVLATTHGYIKGS